MLTIQFNELNAILLDYTGGTYSDGGFLYLRMVGDEPTVNAIWSRLSAREYREKKYESQVQVAIPGRTEYVAAQKVVYKTLRSRLPTGLVDLVMIHPCLTISEDSEAGFFLLTYESGMPDGFFARLNRCLSIPLKEEWATWLWAEGQKAQTWLAIETKEEYEDGQPVERQNLVQTSQTPISKHESRGRVACYRVRTRGPYKAAWLQIIREQLGLGIPLFVTQYGGVERYEETLWSIYAPKPDHWILDCGDEEILSAPSLDFLLAKARDELGRHFVIQGGPHA
jgi:hypothetical protein